MFVDAIKTTSINSLYREDLKHISSRILKKYQSTVHMKKTILTWFTEFLFKQTNLHTKLSEIYNMID